MFLTPSMRISRSPERQRRVVEVSLHTRGTTDRRASAAAIRARHTGSAVRRGGRFAMGAAAFVNDAEVAAPRVEARGWPQRRWLPLWTSNGSVVSPARRSLTPNIDSPTKARRAGNAGGLIGPIRDRHQYRDGRTAAVRSVVALTVASRDDRKRSVETTLLGAVGRALRPFGSSWPHIRDFMSAPRANLRSQQLWLPGPDKASHERQPLRAGGAIRAA
jgi:hypothetical protein